VVASRGGDYDVSQDDRVDVACWAVAGYPAADPDYEKEAGVTVLEREGLMGRSWARTKEA
jgi:hypothetical protein